ncbi:MAG: 4Fe-4S binding protein, partial [Acidobacteriota bacterium]|nr:4Fe-4S binding protein [Acidobacteriota bacterium]
LLVARRTAELTLTPGVVAIDDRETARAVQDLLLPEPETIREWLGDPRAEIDSPTPAQELLFGPRRARVPPWFDPDRPVARGSDPAGEDAAAAQAAREVFFSREVAAALGDGMERLSAMTGRELHAVREHRAGGAKLLLVAHGSSVETAEATVDRLRFVDKRRLGALGLSVLRPFPSEPLRLSLGGAEAVTVLERGVDPLAAGSPLARAVAAQSGTDTVVVSARVTGGGAPLTAAALAAACRNMGEAEGRRPVVWLGVAAPGGSSDLPRQEVLAQRLSRDYPVLSETALPPGTPLDVRPEGARTVMLHARERDLPRSALLEIAGALGETAGPHVRGRETAGPGGLRIACVTAAPEPLRDPGDQPPADVVLLASAELVAQPAVLATAADGARIFLALPAGAAGSTDRLPASWRKATEARGISVFLVEGGPRELIDRLPGWLAGGVEGATEMRADMAAAPDPQADEPELPLAVRRYASSGRGYDDVSRFWGEHAQPRLAGGHAPPFADPFLAVAATPPAAATFADATRSRSEFPRIDPGICTGCGLCWTSCPDSAVAPVALATQVLLDAAFERAGGDPSEPTAAKLRRASRQLAAHLDGRLAKTGTRSLSPDLLREGLDWLLGKLALEDDEEDAARRAFAGVEAEIARLPLAATEALFHEPHGASKGKGALLGIAVSPQACQGCGVCAAVCPEDAISMEPESPGTLDVRREAWRLWEALPDTPGSTIAAAGETSEMGPLAAISMSRHCLMSLVGGDGAEPGSGERIAVRQVAAVVEFERQRSALERLEALDELSGRLRQAIHMSMTYAVEVDDLGQLERALDALPARRASVSEVVTRLDEEGERTDIEVDSMQGLVRTAREIEALRGRIAEGAHGVGRARYGVVASGRSIEAWAAAFARNPFTVPVASGPPERAASLARGLAEGLVARGLDEARLVRRAQLLVEAPMDRDARIAALSRLSAGDLTEDERTLSPPILVLLDEGALVGGGGGAVSRLLATSLSVKLVVLDGRHLARPSVDAALLALSHREAFVAATSIAHPGHLYGAVRAALAHPGPALLHLHAPSPGRHGFPADASIARARDAVTSRVHPLLCYDPRADGAFGLRLSLDGNPAIDRDFAEGDDGQPLTPADWALGEERFRERFAASGDGSTLPIAEWISRPGDQRAAATPTVTGTDGRPLSVSDGLARAAVDRAEAWRTLQEMAGIVTPFTDRVRARLEEELRDAHRAEIAGLEKQQGELQVERLRDRLLQMAGVALRRSPDADGAHDGDDQP